MLEWIDTHTHLEHEYPFSTDEYLANARAQGVRGFITIGTLPGKLAPLKDNAEKYPDVYFTVGTHPHEAKDFDSAAETEMRSLHAHPKCVAVGEIGLDYWYGHSSGAEQKSAMLRQLDLALEFNKPVVIHGRNHKDSPAYFCEGTAEWEMVEAFKTFAAKNPLTKQGRIGVIHCFTGTKGFAEECLKLGFMISFSGIITFKTAQDLRAVAAIVPKDRVLVETDSPFLAPVPYRGKPNQSAYIVETAKTLATAMGLSLPELSKATLENTRKLFKIEY